MSTITELARYTYSMFRPPKHQTVSEWADTNRVLVSESSAEPGSWRTDRAPYQREIMDSFTQPGIWQIVIMASAQVGKALDVNTKIPTPSGWKLMGDLVVGDKVFDENGHQCTVTAATEIMYDHKCYEVVFSDKRSIVADAEHRWSVDCINDYGREIGNYIKTTAEMFVDFKVCKRNRYKIPVAKSLECRKKKLPIPPYTLGVWLGDGNSYAANVTQAKSDTDEILKGLHRDGILTDVKEITSTTNTIILNGKEAIVRDGICIHGHDMNVLGRTKQGLCAECQRQFSKKSQYGFVVDPVVKKTMYHVLRENNLIGNKHIPREYLRASKEQRLALLRGLMDTDGSCDNRGRSEISFASEELAKDVSELLHSLGIKHSFDPKKAICTYNGKKIKRKAWRISFVAYSDVPVFTFKRKFERQKDRNSNTRVGETENRRIVDIHEVESRPVRCITVDSPNHLYLAGEAMIPTHNSEIELNMMGYAVDNDPGPMLYIQPTDKVAEDYSKRRIAPMIQACPTLRNKVFKAKGRDSANTITMKTFPGGSLAIIGANSPADLASKPVRYVFMDETDRFPASAGTEGDPQELAERRTETFRHNRKIVKTSTPTIKGRSKIESDYMSGTQEEWHVECPHCRTYSFIKFNDVKFDKEEFKNDRGDQDWHVTDVRWQCPVCNRDIPEHICKRLPGKWVSKNPKAIDNGIRSFRLNAFMSPWSDWKEICWKFLRAGKDPEKLKTFYNTILGETWEIFTSNGLENKLHQRREHYDAEIPHGVLLLTMGMDTQDNRLEYEVVGWDRNGQSWGINRGIIPGRADSPGVWEEVDNLLDKEWKFKNGIRLKILATFIDSGGHFTQDIYRECAKRQSKRIWPIKGEGGEGKQYCRPMKKAKASEGMKFIIGVDDGKAGIMYEAGIEEPGPHYMHFPKDYRAGYDMEFFKGLISERMVIHRVKGQSSVMWEKIYERNEPLDCRNYARAAYRYFNWHFDDLEMLVNGVEKQAPVVTKSEETKKKQRHVVSRGIKV